MAEWCKESTFEFPLRFNTACILESHVHRHSTSSSSVALRIPGYHATLQIEQLGTVASIQLDAGGCALVISDCGSIMQDCHIGDSIAVNGACLTVTEFDTVQDGGYFRVWLANETLARTDLGMRYTGGQPRTMVMTCPRCRRSRGRRADEPRAGHGGTHQVWGSLCPGANHLGRDSRITTTLS